jgi:drug/metabolite transporter (DMT)-like permease
MLDGCGRAVGRCAARKRHDVKAWKVKRQYALLAVVVSAACFGTLAVLTPAAYAQGASPLPLLAWRFVFAAMLLGTVATLRERRALVISRADLGRYALLALTGYGAASVCFFYALTFADASVVAVLLYAYPAFVTIVSWPLLGERITWQRGLAVVTTFLGCALVVGLGSADVQAKWQGVALGLGAAVGYTLFNLLSHRWLPGRSRLTMMTYTFGLASILPIVGTIASVGLIGLSPAAWTPSVWWLLLAIVLIPTFAAIVLYLEGIRGLGPSQAAVISTLEPLFTIVLAGIFLAERLSPLQFAGAALVLSGVVAAEMLARRTDMPAPA